MPAALIAEYANALQLTVGGARYEQLIQCKAQRDGDGDYHVTLISPVELSKLPFVEVSDVSCGLLGLGRVANSLAETFFVVVESPEGQSLRQQHGLRPRDLHVTLGFFPTGIYDVPKDESTIFWRH